MSRYLQSKCIDINSAYCPCILASANHCVFCAQLQGKDICDCNWSGICILYEQKWNARNDLVTAKPQRTEMECSVIDRHFITEKICRIVLDVPRAMAEQLRDPGSFVFLRRNVDPQYYHIPIGIMKVIGDHQIVVVAEAVGIKSLRLVEEDQTVMLRGPYKNGIFGSPWIDKLTNGKVLLIAGGMGQPPALPVAEKLTRNYNKVTAIISAGTTGFIVTQELQDMGVNIVTVDSLRRVGYHHFASLLAETDWDLVVSCGPDAQHSKVIDAMRNIGCDLPMAATNNNVMCCGEGICGSCTKETNQHQQIRTCKVQVDITDLKRE